MSLVEYLYVDDERLDTYFEQVSSPVKFDKVPVWEASLTMTSPGAKGTQQRFPRPYTTHEKITRLMEYLREENLLSDHTALEEGDYQEDTFHMASLFATRAFFPPKHGGREDFTGLALWFASSTNTSHDNPVVSLYLLEDFQGNDVPPEYRRHESAYGAVGELIENLEIEGQFFMTVADTTVDDGIFNRDMGREKHQLKLLSNLGARMGRRSRKISCLFRVRAAVGPEGGYSLRVYGYLIFISAGDWVLGSTNTNQNSGDPYTEVRPSWWRRVLGT